MSCVWLNFAFSFFLCFGFGRFSVTNLSATISSILETTLFWWKDRAGNWGFKRFATWVDDALFLCWDWRRWFWSILLNYLIKFQVGNELFFFTLLWWKKAGFPRAMQNRKVEYPCQCFQGEHTHNTQKVIDIRLHDSFERRNGYAEGKNDERKITSSVLFILCWRKSFQYDLVIV